MNNQGINITPWVLLLMLLLNSTVGNSNQDDDSRNCSLSTLYTYCTKYSKASEEKEKDIKL